MGVIRAELDGTALLEALGAASEPPAGSDARILVVDPDASGRAALAMLLAGPGRVIVECADGRAAMACIAEAAARPFDLAVLEARLPDMAGVDLLRYAEAKGRTFPVILVSVDEAAGATVQVIPGSANDFIRKPCDPARFRKSVENALAARRLQDENRWMRARLAQADRLQRYLVTNSPDLIYMVDESGVLRYVNDAFSRLLGFAEHDLIGTDFARIVHEDDLGLALDARRSGERGAERPESIEVRLCKAAAGKHDPLWQADTVTVALQEIPLFAPGPAESTAARRRIGFYGVARDITERKRAEETAVFHAFHDSLTGLPNRTIFRDHLDLALAQAGRSGRNTAVLFIDLDRFKVVNDTYGHVLGDQILRQAAWRLRHCLRGGDTLSRIGGDEFTALVPELRSAADAEVVARKMVNALAEPFHLGEAEFSTTVSVGIAMYPEHGSNADELIRHADLAMYQVKRRGKNGLAFFEPAMMSMAGANIGLENDLRRALRLPDELQVYFQPVFDTSRGVVDRVEALVRWRHPDHGLLDPSQFIPMAEEAGLLHELSLLVMDRACGQLALWRRDRFHGLSVAINVSPSEFERSDFVAGVLGALRRHALPPDALELEITENVLIEDIDAAVERVKRLRSYGVRVSIDDFGIRYSSLGYLQRLPVNTIKIDQSFVRELGEDRPASPIVPAIIQIARGFGFDLVAEGVEGEDHVNRLKALGCTKMQGFFFRKPDAAPAITSYLLSNMRTA